MQPLYIHYRTEIRIVIMMDSQITFSFKTLIFTAIIFFATFNNYVTGDHYNDITSQVRVPLFCDEIDRVHTSWMKPSHDVSEKFYTNTDLNFTPTSEDKKTGVDIPIFHIIIKRGN